MHYAAVATHKPTWALSFATKPKALKRAADEKRTATKPFQTTPYENKANGRKLQCEQFQRVLTIATMQGFAQGYPLP
jgi:hypothetical protein